MAGLEAATHGQAKSRNSNRILPTSKRGVPTVLKVRLVSLLQDSVLNQIIQYGVKHPTSRMIAPKHMLWGTMTMSIWNQTKRDAQAVCGSIPIRPVLQQNFERCLFHDV
jgi:hypothetical protein